MTITLYTGLPRSGKTYRAVHDIVHNYYDYDEENAEYVRKPIHKKTLIATNIKGLSDSFPDIWDWNEKLIEKHIKFQEFFTEDFQKELMSEGGYEKCFYVFDDCSKYFRRVSYDYEDVENYMDIHGHLGHSIYMITQHRTKIAKGYVNLCELEIRALAKSIRFSKELKYIHYVGGYFAEKTGYSAIKLDPKISSLYNSADVEGAHGEKLKNPLMFYVIFILVGMGLIGYFTYNLFFKGTFSGGGSVLSLGEKKQVVKPETNSKDVSELRKKMFTKSTLSGDWKYLKNTLVMYKGDKKEYYVVGEDNVMLPLNFYEDKYEAKILGGTKIFIRPK